MMLHILLVAEILATILCIHCIYGKKVTFDIKTIGTILAILAILEAANYFKLSGMFSIIGYVVLFVYCKSEFNSSIAEAISAILLCIIVMTSIQFVCVTFVYIVIPEKLLVRDTIVNILMVGIYIIILPKCRLHQLQKEICRKNKYVFILVVFMCLIVILMLLNGKLFYEVQFFQFALVIPSIFLLLYSILKIYIEQTEKEKIQEELCIIEKTSGEYENLLTKVRLRQHELKNHIAAIFSTHYTYKTYEKLVQAQEEYCQKILDENKYNNLPLLGNNILVGYLYGKFQEAETDGITITYQIRAKISEMSIPIYYVIEMLGILLDNAMEALKLSTEREIFFEALESKSEYIFSIRNPYHYVAYDEITEWFQLGRSEKGSGRGLGLYHLKCLCEEWHCDIECRNIEIEQTNWIVFSIKIKKADSM